MSAKPQTPSPRFVTRNLVYSYIDRELEKQDASPKPDKIRSIEAEILLLEHLLQQARTCCIQNPGDYTPTLENVRKLTAVAVRCLEQYGCKSPR